VQDDEHTDWLRMVRTELKIQEVGASQLFPYSQMVDEVTAAVAEISHGTCHKIV
jgi:hypothetical protein